MIAITWPSRDHKQMWSPAQEGGVPPKLIAHPHGNDASVGQNIAEPLRRPSGRTGLMPPHRPPPPSRSAARETAPALTAQGVIDRMRQWTLEWSIVGSVRPLHGPGRQRSHASAGQPGRPEGEDQLGPTMSQLGLCCRRMFHGTRRANQMCSTNSLRLRRRHHRLPGIHRRPHSDRQAAILRGSGPVSGPVAGRA